MSKPTVVDLVFEGGGMKGIAFIGALRALATYNYQPGRLLGTSVGSLFAALLAAGYSANELYNIIFDSKTGELTLAQHIKPYSSFGPAQIEASATRRLLKTIDVSWVPNIIEGGIDTLLARILMEQPSLKEAFNYIEKGGVHDPEPFVEWLGELLGAKTTAQSGTPPGALTLAQFHEITGYHLSLIAADVTNPTLLILNHITAPDCPLVQAIRMATAAPLFFPPVIWQPGWGFYRRQEITGDFIVDGALLSNFPIELFLSQQQMVTSMMGEPNEKAGVLGLLLDESIAVPGAPPATTPPWQQMLNDLPGFSLFIELIMTVLEARDKHIIESASEHVVHLPTMGYPAYTFNLTPEQLQLLLNAGHNAMIAHLETHQFPSSSRYFSESAKRQVDNKAIHIINVYGNLVNVNQKIGEVSGKVIGVSETGSGNEAK